MKLCILFLMLIGIIGCATSVNTSDQDPTQLGTRQVEVRTLDVPHKVAYQAAMQAFFSLGYAIQHTDRASLIITGSRQSGVKEAKKSSKTKKAVSALGGAGGFLIRMMMSDKQPTTFHVTMLLKPIDPKQTQIRFKMQVDGEPVWDPTVIDRLWVTTQREAMLETGPPPTPTPTTTTLPTATPMTSPATTTATATPTIKKQDN